MRIPLLSAVSGMALATAVALGHPQPARAWITQTTDNSPAPTPWLPPWLHWHPRPKAPPPPPRPKYCPPYYSETHGYTPPTWRPWPGGVGDTSKTAAPKADVSPPKETQAPSQTQLTPKILPDTVEGGGPATTALPRQ